MAPCYLLLHAASAGATFVSNNTSPPPPPLTLPLQRRRLATTSSCTNTCRYSHDGECDDGGAGSHYSLCALGTDCNDCGTRNLEYALSLKGVDLKRGEWSGDGYTSFSACTRKASAAKASYFAWTGQVYQPGYCKVLKSTYEGNPNLGTNQGYGYKLWERVEANPMPAPTPTPTHLPTVFPTTSFPTSYPTPPLPTSGTCYEAYAPHYSSCSGYTSVGYSCVGRYGYGVGDIGWCAALDPGGHPSHCAENKGQGCTISAGRCTSCTPTTPLPANRAFDISGTGVEYVPGSQCITDGADHYSNNEDATITVLRDGAINSEGQFVTESGYDYLTIDATRYSGSSAPMNVQVSQGDTLAWHSDSSATRHGWTICLEPAPTPTPTPDPTPAPTPAPTKYPTFSPTRFPTPAPSAPTRFPTPAPSRFPTPAPSEAPSFAPTPSPSVAPTATPTASPTTAVPTTVPTMTPSKMPTTTGYTYEPSLGPTSQPTHAPTKMPTATPSTATPTAQPSRVVSVAMPTAAEVESANDEWTSPTGVLYVVLCAAVSIIAIAAIVVAISIAIVICRRPRRDQEALPRADNDDAMARAAGVVVGRDPRVVVVEVEPPEEMARLRLGIAASLREVELRSRPSAPPIAAAAASREGEEENLCCICLVNPRTHAFVPCGHRCVCVDCTTGVMDNSRRCPMCRTAASGALVVYG